MGPDGGDGVMGPHWGICALWLPITDIPSCRHGTMDTPIMGRYPVGAKMAPFTGYRVMVDMQDHYSLTRHIVCDGKYPVYRDDAIMGYVPMHAYAVHDHYIYHYSCIHSTSSTAGMDISRCRWISRDVCIY